MSSNAVSRLLCFLACLLLGTPLATGASLSLRPHPIEVEGRFLDEDARFARIDSLEALYDRAEGAQRGDYAQRLGQLYLSTEMFEHRRFALDYLEEAQRLLPDGYEVARLRAAVTDRMGYTGDARKAMQAFGHDHPGDPRPHVMLGRSYFLEARERLRADLFERAANAFRRATECDESDVEAWYGWAACALALDDPARALPAVDRLAALAPGDARSLWIEGAVAMGVQDAERAHLVWSEALQRSDPAMRDVFLQAEGFLEAKDLERLAARVIDRPTAQAALVRRGEDEGVGEEIDWSQALEDSLVRARTLTAYWGEIDERPTRTYNLRQLEYWRRLVEADLLFGDAEGGRRGWDTPTGSTYVRYGRPTSTFYDPGTPGTGGNLLDDLDNAGVRLLPGESVPVGVAVWAWTYRRPDAWFSLIFTDGSMNKRWVFGESSARTAAIYRAQQPLSFEPETEAPSPFRLAVSRLIFPRGDDTAVLETLIGIRPQEEWSFETLAAADSTGADRAPTVEWALYDEHGERIDYREEVLVEENRRSWLHDALGWVTTDGVLDPYVLPIGARVPSGRYRLAVEAWGPGRRGHDSIVIDVEVPPSEPPTLLELSDLQLASAFAPLEAGTAIPLRYAKYGQVIVPVPDLRVPAGAARLGVYFEVRNLALDDAGSTRFDVTYEVFASSRELRQITSTADFQREDLSRIDPLTLTFLEERTGQSADGLVVKGAALDVRDLPAGDYVLVATVRDRIGQREASRAMPFRKRGD